MSRLRETERFLRAGERLSLLRDAERSRFEGKGDFFDRLLSLRGGDLRRSLLRDEERSRRIGDRLSRPRETDLSRRGGERLRETERSRRTGDFLDRLSRRNGDFLDFRSLERNRRSLDLLRLSRERLRRSLVRLFLSRERLRLSRERLRLSLATGREFSFDRPLERRTGFGASSLFSSFASFFFFW